MGERVGEGRGSRTDSQTLLRGFPQPRPGAASAPVWAAWTRPHPCGSGHPPVVPGRLASFTSAARTGPTEVLTAGPRPGLLSFSVSGAITSTSSGTALGWLSPRAPALIRVSGQGHGSTQVCTDSRLKKASSRALQTALGNGRDGPSRGGTDAVATLRVMGAPWCPTSEKRGLSFSRSTLEWQLLEGFAVMSFHSS